MDLTTETDRLRLERALDVYPCDWVSRLVLADVLEEAGEDVAAWGQRWQARRGAVPLYNPLMPHGELAWSWWDGEGWESVPIFFRLPRLLMALLARSEPEWVHLPSWRAYPTRAAAEADLARALSLLPDRGAPLLPATVEIDS